MDPKLKKLVFKTVVFTLNVVAAWYLIRNGFLNNLIITLLPLKFVSEFIAGVLYASFLTSPISLAMIVILAKTNNPITLALLAGLGAACADLLIVKLFREKLSSDVNLVSHELHFKRIENFLLKWKLTFLTPLIGATVIASPLPDELGLMLLGVSKLRYEQIAIISFTLNTVGILVIAMPISVLS